MCAGVAILGLLCARRQLAVKGSSTDGLTVDELKRTDKALAGEEREAHW